MGSCCNISAGAAAMVLYMSCLITLLGFFSAVPVAVHGQLDSLGFISIDCGIAGGSGYTDSTTNLTYTSDEAFIDGAGENYNISVEYVTPTMSRRYWNVRSFADGERNCYTMESLTTGLKYLVRASFLYGNYDGLNKLPVFDLYIGVNLWTTMNISDATSAFLAEVITVAPAEYLQVCLVNTGLGTPFISGLDLRTLKTLLYPAVNATQSVVLYARLNMGPTNDVIYRYPADAHDRIWLPWSNVPIWAEVSTNSTVQNVYNDHFEVPSVVMQTAVAPANGSFLNFSWTPDASNGPDPGFVAVMHFSELQLLTSNALRQFDISINGKPWYALPFSPDYLYSDAVYATNPSRQVGQYSANLTATRNSTLPPLLNALELFTVLPTTQLGTDDGDVSAITAIKTQYQLKRNWMGDPCTPKTLAWDGLNCSYDISGPSTITTLNLSSSGLTGEITTSFADLKTLQYLDLSHNNLTGPIPNVLSQLTSLTLLDLTSNQLNGSIPAGLLKRSQDGSLTLRVGDNKNLCANGNSCVLTSKKKSSTIVMAMVVPIVVVVVLAVSLVIFCILRKKQGSATSTTIKPQNEEQPMAENNHEQSSLQLEKRQFTYKELEVITNNFQHVIGRGGFGAVYDGFLENGTQVAVKMRSHLSHQGVKEFLAEAQHLTKIHHKNLVVMIGYCKDGDYLALVYEYMPEGTLQEHLRGRGHNTPLTWRQRLRIALESAQGLEYLHKGCNPPLIHRDVKTNNILLNANLQAKIADFGLSKAFDSDINTHVSTAVVGTPGYLDPEYHATFQLNDKSDVYSFGVVLLEVITGQPAIMPGAESVNIIHWVRQRLARGNIESVVDARMNGQYDVNSVWKAADVALKCTAQAPSQRPTMTDVVMQLKECIELEGTAGQTNHNLYAGNSNPSSNARSDYLYTEASGASQNSGFEAEPVGRISVSTGPSAR